MQLKNWIKYCGSCAFRAQDGTRCGLTGLNIDPAADFCTKFESSPDICDICGKFIVGRGIIDGNHVICQNCLSKMGTCTLCDNSKYCDFEGNPSPIPKMVQKQIRQGNMVAMTTIQNPDRIKETCKKNCICFSPSFGCMRQVSGACGKSNFSYN